MEPTFCSPSRVRKSPLVPRATPSLHRPTVPSSPTPTRLHSFVHHVLSSCQQAPSCFTASLGKKVVPMIPKPAGGWRGRGPYQHLGGTHYSTRACSAPPPQRGHSNCSLLRDGMGRQGIDRQLVGCSFCLLHIQATKLVSPPRASAHTCPVFLCVPLYPVTNPPVHPPIHSPIHPPSQPASQQSMHPSTHPSMHPPIHLPVVHPTPRSSRKCYTGSSPCLTISPGSELRDTEEVPLWNGTLWPSRAW